MQEEVDQLAIFDFVIPDGTLRVDVTTKMIDWWPHVELFFVTPDEEIAYPIKGTRDAMFEEKLFVYLGSLGYFRAHCKKPFRSGWVDACYPPIPFEAV